METPKVLCYVAMGVAGLHFFVFGGFNKTCDWIGSHRPR